MPKTTPAEVPFQQIVDALLDVDHPFNPRFLTRLSDLEQHDLISLKAAWSHLPLWRKQALMEDVEKLSEEDTLLSFEALGRLAVEDEDPKVRLLGVRTLWVYEQNSLIPILLRLLENDIDADVRAAAAGALGPYVFAGELDELPAKALRSIEDTLLKVANSDDVPLVRRTVLESLGYSSREEVNPLIEAAYISNEKVWKASALFAMGRSANKDWKPQVMEMLESNFPVLRSEAARAAGELEISDAVPLLIDLLEDPDDNTRMASIWSLSQIGGEGVHETLEQMYENAEDQHEIDVLEAALDNLTFTESAQLLPLFDFPEGEEKETTDSEDLLGYDEDPDY